MTHEQNPQQPFKDSYPLPSDQLAAEFELVNTYAAEYPNNVVALNHTLAQLNHYGGLGPATLKLVEGQEGSEELAQILNNRPSPGSTTSLTVRAPFEMPSRNESGVSDEAYDRQSRLSEGLTIIGEPSRAENALLEGIYGLTGAEVVRNDEHDGEPIGSILRRGSINGRLVFFEEAYTSAVASQTGERSMKIFMLGEEWGNSAMVEPSRSEVDQLVDAQGIDPTQAIAFMSQHGITRANIVEFLQPGEQPRHSLERFAGQVAVQEPNAAKFEVNLIMDADTVPAFAASVSQTVLDLSRKFEKLTPAEAKLVESAADEGASSLHHMLTTSNVPLPLKVGGLLNAEDRQRYEDAIHAVQRLLPAGMRGHDGFGYDDAFTADALAMIPGETFIGHEQERRARTEDLAMGIMRMFAVITKNAALRGRPVEVDGYLKEKLTYLQSTYDALKQ